MSCYGVVIYKELCMFHVQDLEIKRNKKWEIMCIIQELIYAKSEQDFNKQVKILETKLLA